MLRCLVIKYHLGFIELHIDETGFIQIMSKIKILCLHGYQQNKTDFQQKTGSFRKPLKKYAEFIFMDAPHLLKDSSLDKVSELTEHSANVPSETSSDKRGWWLKNPADGEDDGLHQSLQVFEKILSEDGPFDGVMAFSQGAAFLALACILLKEKSSFNSIRFLIFVAGFKSRMPLHEQFYDIRTKLSIPSLHVVGETDQIITPDRSKLLLDIFINGQLVLHPGGHYVPASKELREVYSQFIEQFINK